MSAQKYDLIVIGSGPGGYVCAIRAAQLGLKVACVEKRDTLGGTCLNIGCIPSKALLSASEKYESAEKHFEHMGITVGKLGLDLGTMMNFKDEVVEANTKGIEFLFKKNKVTYVKGKGVIKSAGEVSVGGQSLKTKKILIATGSDIARLPGLEIVDDPTEDRRARRVDVVGRLHRRARAQRHRGHAHGARGVRHEDYLGTTAIGQRRQEEFRQRYVELAGIDPQPAVHRSAVHFHALDSRPGTELVRKSRIDPDQGSALARSGDRHLAADHESDPAEHLLLDRITVVEQGANPAGEFLVEGHQPSGTP